MFGHRAALRRRRRHGENLRARTHARVAVKLRSGCRFQAPVIVAVFPVRMVQVPLDQIVGVIAVQHGLMPAIGSMNVAGFVCPALVVRRAAILVRRPIGQRVLVDMISMYVVQMTVVKIIGVPVMRHCLVSAR